MVCFCVFCVLLRLFSHPCSSACPRANLSTRQPPNVNIPNSLSLSWGTGMSPLRYLNPCPSVKSVVYSSGIFDQDHDQDQDHDNRLSLLAPHSLTPSLHPSLLPHSQFLIGAPGASPLCAFVPLSLIPNSRALARIPPPSFHHSTIPTLHPSPSVPSVVNPS